MNLQDLNQTLFDTINGLKDGSVSVQNANAIVNASKQIAENTKVQMQGLKLFSELGYEPSENEGTPIKALLGNVFDRKLEYAKSIGYSNVADAIGKMGKEKFEKSFYEHSK